MKGKACQPFRGCISVLYLVYLSWFSGLIALVVQEDIVAMILLGLAMVLLIPGVSGLAVIRRISMFRKKTSVLPAEESVGADRNQGSPVSVQDTTLTVVGAGTVVEGEITCGRDVDIYGQFTGGIRLQEGTVRVFNGGAVRGDIAADNIIIGGMVDGCCEGRSLTILEQGILNGMCRSEIFSIKSGGVFLGTSECWPDLPGVGNLCRHTSEFPIPAEESGPEQDIE